MPSHRCCNSWSSKHSCLRQGLGWYGGGGGELLRRGEYYVAQEQSETDAELLKDKSKCPHIIVATPGHLNALVRDKVLDGMVGEEVSC
jgi:hypothetical protein